MCGIIILAKFIPCTIYGINTSRLVVWGGILMRVTSVVVGTVPPCGIILPSRNVKILFVNENIMGIEN